MSDQEARERRQIKFGNSRSKGREVETFIRPGPEARYRRREKWSDDYAGEDPHDDEFFQDRELDFNE